MIGQDIETVQRFTDTIQALPEVVECHLMVGDCDFLLKIVVSNIEEYRQLQIKHLKRENSVQNIKTEIPMQKIKQTSAVPLD
ncbi:MULTISPECIES: Lrp/AsnC ligand binding domain-containing protein [Acinetobacter]|uniref:Lrp/AsnC ligand binding domain-containing protein n=1 Tax=Acinetobacter TaxID=469 RepID=UPI001D1903E9|nr:MULTISPECIES: Lrp/AsnC ligand binding domain-containing protein [Acinetobacter]MEB6564506.1 Lrp/AsnC ligand binding domain-containing protein [Acinetobacter towneri]